MAQHQYGFTKNDECYTPENAVYPIMQRLKPGSSIWCPFDTSESNYVKVFTGNGFKVKHGHISTGQDFFQVEVPECDYIISNPPFSRKADVFERLYSIGKPFAMLMNAQGLFDHRRRFEMFKSNRVEMLWLSPRVDYLLPGSTKPGGVPFQSAYVCSGILKNQIEFDYIQKRKDYNNGTQNQ